ncbi:MAG: glycosyltransferase family 39 protein [Sphingomonas sp.]|nr:glycosyltransferase family 39 protein [Sphingomonas sp.]
MGKIDWRSRAVALGLGVAALVLFLPNLARPDRAYFDEVYYTDAARRLAAWHSLVNIEHPPLAKAIIALGIKLFGDAPFGWRVFSCVAGAVCAVALFAIARRILGRDRPAAVATGFALMNFMLFVQSRIAMLDIFMASFLLSGVALLFGAWRMRRLGTMTLAGALMGAATACKWSAAPFVALACLALLATGRRRLAASLTLGSASLFAYFLTFAPALFVRHDPLTLAGLLPRQLEMYRAQTQVYGVHQYQSPAWSWPLDLRPIWYLYEPIDGVWRAVLLVGNPLVFWPGLAAVIGCLALGLARRSAPLLGAAGLWGASYGVLLLIPKKIGFLYYYLLPSLFLGLAIVALAEAVKRRWVAEALLAASAACFVYYYPVLTAAPLAGGQAFKRYALLPSWP